MSRRFCERVNSFANGPPSGLPMGHRQNRSYSLHPSSTVSRSGSVVRLTAPMHKAPESVSYEYIGFLMPVYMAPMLFGGKEGICFYCCLLPLAWWTLSSVPRPIAAFLPFVTLPIFNIMDSDHLSSAFFSVEVLIAVTFLSLMMVLSSQTTLIPRVSFRVCGFFGLQMRYLFVWLSVVTYLTTQFVSNTLLAMLLVLAIDKVLNCVHEQQLDVHRCPNASDEMGIFQALSGKGSPTEPDTDVLFDELAAAVFKYRKQSAASRRSTYGSNHQGERSPVRRPQQAQAPFASSSASSSTLGRKDSKWTISSKSSDQLDRMGIPPPDALLLDEKLGRKGKRGRIFQQDMRTKRAGNGIVEHEKSRKERKKRSVCIAAGANVEPNEEKEEQVHKNKHTTTSYSLRSASPSRESAKTSPSHVVLFTPESNVQTLEAMSPESPTAWTDAREKPGVRKDEPWSSFAETDPRRPSILRVRDSYGRIHSPRLHSQRRSSVVDFGPTTCRTITGHFPPEMPNTGWPIVSEGGSRSNSPLADGRVPWLDHREHRRASEMSSPFADRTSHPELNLEEQLRRTRRLESLRTAFLVGSTLVTVTGSLASYWTVPARGAMQKHFAKDGVGMLTWVILTMPTALLSTITCCIPLFLMHLKESDVADDSEDQREICALAITKLNSMGPFKAWDLIALSMFALYFLVVFTALLTGAYSRTGVLLLLSTLMIICSFIGPSGNDPLSRSRMFLWRAIVNTIPWGVVVIFGSVEVISKAVEVNRLLPALFQSMGGDFWQQNSILANQIAFAVFGSILAEVMNNALLCNLVVPFVLEVAAATRTAPLMYAIPAAVTCSSNIILPISMPLVVMHEVLPVSMAQLLMIGFVTKVTIVVTIIVSVNTTGRLVLAVAPPPNSTSSARTTLLFPEP